MHDRHTPFGHSPNYGAADSCYTIGDADDALDAQNAARPYASTSAAASAARLESDASQLESDAAQLAASAEQARSKHLDAIADATSSLSAAYSSMAADLPAQDRLVATKDLIAIEHAEGIA